MKSRKPEWYEPRQKKEEQAPSMDNEPMYAATEEKKKRAFDVGASAWLFVASYLLMMLCIFLMIVINEPHGWIAYFQTQYFSFLSLCLSVLLLFGIIFYYLYFEDKEFLSKPNNLFLIFVTIIVCVDICYVFGRFVSIFLRPMAMFAMICLFLFSRRRAIIFNCVFSLLMFVIDVYTNNFSAAGEMASLYISLLLGIVCGTFAVFCSGNVKTRGGLLLTGIFLSLPAMAVVLILELAEFDLAQFDWITYVSYAGYGILGCVLSAVFAMSFLPFLERMFNRLTVFRLRELTGASAPILRRLQEEAPGTFNHSSIVAQLAETCALAIDENAELARAAAFYHDVGKLKQPECFTENQTDYNLHDELTPELSADIIRSHAQDGYDFLMAMHMPKEFADVAREHHGTLPIKYFYDKAMRLSGGDAKIQDYSYLGPTPSTKIAAIIMIADAAEAAVRAMNSRSPEAVERIVRLIIEERMDLDQFSNCNITMRELTTIKKTIVETLTGVHHHRVKYPGIRFNRKKQAVKEDGSDQ